VLFSVFASAAALIGSVSALDRFSGAISYMADIGWVPSGLKRLISALSLLRLEDTLKSRAIFLEFANYVSDGFTLFGVGADSFIDYVPLVGAKYNLALGWRDNSNNFFLGMVCELGIVGFLAFGLSVLGRRIIYGCDRRLALGALSAVVLLGFTGPHTDFIEVLILLGVLVSMTTDVRPLFKSKVNEGGFFCLTVVVVMVVTGFVSVRFREQGGYPWGVHGGEVTRWLSHHSLVALRCSGDERMAKLTIRARYIPQRDPLKVRYGALSNMDRSEQELVSELFLVDDRPIDINFKCPRSGIVPDMQFVWLRIFPAWSPYRAWPGRSLDRRILGVEQIGRSER
jgi:hypothetical protein